jgi:predicted nucleotidyltransferase
MIHIDPADLTVLRSILNIFKYTFYAYGSRVKGTHRKFSDLDLCVMEPLSDLEMFYLEEAFEESNLPFKVDVRRWSDMSKNFRTIVQDDLVKL